MSEKRTAGFTLLEMLVVLAIIAIASALTLPFIKRSTPRIDVAANGLLFSLNQSRADALSNGKPVSISFDPEERLLTADNERRPIAIDQAITIKILTAKSDKSSAATFKFLPDGSSTGGEIVLKDDNEQRRITVSWLTGRITLESLSSP